MTVAVTGGRGFVGRWLVDHLIEKGDDVVATGHDVDVTDLDALTALFARVQPSRVYHLAGKASVGRSWHDPVATFAVNALGTVNVLEAIRRTCTSALPRLLLASSAEVYGAAG